MLYEIPRELFKQFKDKKSVIQRQRPAHLALHLPEIVSHILSYLVIPYQYDELKKIKFYQHIYPCLFVNVLWNDCATRLIWRHITFEDIKSEYNAFIKFSETVSSDSSNTLLSHQKANATMKFSYVTGDFNQDPLFLDYQHYANFALQPQLQPNTKNHTNYHSSKKSLCVNSIRSITLRKIKEKTINEPLIDISKHIQKLEKLDIYICDHVSDFSVQSFVQSCNFNLTYLSLAGCNRVTDEAIIAAAHYCPKLEHLDLRACGLISDLSIEAIGQHCPNLHHLNVGRVRDREKITMRSINVIAQKTKVAVLGLAGCDMTDECLILLAKLRGPGLERISVNNCNRITNKTLRAYVKYCPNLSVFEMKECHHINDWESVASLVQRKVLLTLCDQQNRACTEWAKKQGRIMEVKAPIK